MSEELKTYDFPVDHGDFTTTIELFYLKSETDKTIAELKRQIEFLKVTHNSCGDCNKCAEGMGKLFDENLNELKEKLSEERSAKVNYKISANDLSDGIKKAYAEIRRLHRCVIRMTRQWLSAIDDMYSRLDDVHGMDDQDVIDWEKVSELHDKLDKVLEKWK